MRPEEVPAELVDKALAAAFRMPDGYAEAHPGVMSDLRVAYGDQYRHALAAVLPEIQAQALRDAADDWDALVQREVPPVRGSVWLKSRAARLTATTEEPTDG